MEQLQREPHGCWAGQENKRSSGARTSETRGGNENHRKDKTTVKAHKVTPWSPRVTEVHVGQSALQPRAGLV